MKKILDFEKIEIIDIIPFSCGILFPRKEILPDDKCKVTFYGFDMEKMRNAPVTRSVYMLNKFGSGYQRIVDEVGDYLNCDADSFSGNGTVIVYPTGETGVFDYGGKPIWAGDLLYHDCPVQDVASDGNQIWCTVPDQNAIISYSVAHKKFYMRIGGENSAAFSRPVSLSKYGNELFICNAGSYKIRTVNLKDYSVRDFRTFDEPVRRYVRTCGKEIVQLDSGVYIL